MDQFIDVVMGNRKYINCLYCYNKIDEVGTSSLTSALLLLSTLKTLSRQISIEEVDRLAREDNTVVVSCESDLNLDFLIDQMWHHLDLIRVYTKKRGEFPDFEGGLILKRGTTVEGVCRSIHKSLVDEFNVGLLLGTFFDFNSF